MFEKVTVRTIDPE